MRHVPLSRRSGLLKQGLKPEGQQFEVYCAEIFHTLEEQTSATALLESLGESSGEYKSLSTNSKSGEFFFLSHDRKFLIKTVSEAEGRLLFRMLPEYQDHIHSLPAIAHCALRWALSCRSGKRKLEILPRDDTRFSNRPL